MRIPPSSSIAALRGPILRSVSRSFYLSIRFLPASLRDPIALAYLLARATDTIADTADLDAGKRTAYLASLARLIQGERGEPDELARLAQSFAPLQQDPAERALITQLPACLDWLAATGEDDRIDIRRVLATINHGQALDVKRFGDSSRIVALATAAQLEEYTYLVAGCVGEFWTRICFRHVPRFATLSEAEMVALGVAYGKALQLTNILRDFGADLRGGRCYLPADELRSFGITAAELQTDSRAAQPVLDTWRNRAQEGMKAGVEYACAVRSWRIRLATALPALIGARTLSLLRDAVAESFARRVKVPRNEVRRILFTLLRRLASPRAVRKLYEQLSA